MEPKPLSHFPAPTPTPLSSSFTASMSNESDFSAEKPLNKSILDEFVIKNTVQKTDVDELEIDLFEKAVSLINQPQELEQLPRASAGMTPVYFPHELPLILKKSDGSSQDRLVAMQKGRALLKKCQSSHLIIPPAKVHGPFIIETRLPISQHLDAKANIGLYLENIEKFASVAEELMTLFCYAVISDTNSDDNEKGYFTLNPYSHLTKVAMVRYDNLPLYLENGLAKLGLIDLGCFIISASSSVNFDCIKRVVLIFPHHFDRILNVAKQLNPGTDIEEWRSELESIRDRVLEFHSKIYLEHLGFVRLNGILPSNPAQLPVISLTRKEEIKEVVSRHLREEIAPGVNVEGVISAFEERAFSCFFEGVLDLISEMIKENIESEYGDPEVKLSSYSELLMARTIKFHSDRTEYYKFIQGVEDKLDMIPKKTRYQKRFNLIPLIVDCILKELANGKELAYYKRIDNSMSLIFC